MIKKLDNNLKPEGNNTEVTTLLLKTLGLPDAPKKLLKAWSLEE